MSEYQYTEYFENEVLRKRSYLRKEWCIRVIKIPLKLSDKNITVIDFGEKSMNWVDVLYGL